MVGQRPVLRFTRDGKQLSKFAYRSLDVVRLQGSQAFCYGKRAVRDRYATFHHRRPGTSREKMPRDKRNPERHRTRKEVASEKASSHDKTFFFSSCLTFFFLFGLVAACDARIRDYCIESLYLSRFCASTILNMFSLDPTSDSLSLTQPGASWSRPTIVSVIGLTRESCLTP